MSIINVLMCAPDHFRVDYEINDWMNRNDQPRKILARIVWWRLFGFYGSFGINVELIQPVSGLPDMVFTANAGLVYKNKFIPSNFYHKERRAEAAHFIKFFRDKGFEIAVLPSDVFFEGQGDALRLSENTLLLGYGQRTSEVAVGHLRAFCGEWNIIPLEMIYAPTSDKPKKFYHLDTALCHLPMTNTFLVYPEAFTPEALSTIRGLGEVIEVDYQEAKDLICNSVVFEKYILMPLGENPRVVKILEDKGYKVFLLDTSEFLKAGGSVRCLSFFY